MTAFTIDNNIKYFLCAKCKNPVYADQGYLLNGEKYCKKCYKKVFPKFKETK